MNMPNKVNIRVATLPCVSLARPALVLHRLAMATQTVRWADLGEQEWSNAHERINRYEAGPASHLHRTSHDRLRSGGAPNGYRHLQAGVAQY